MNTKAIADKATVEKAILERDIKTHQGRFNEIQGRLDEASRNLSDLEVIRNRLSAENGDLNRRLDDADSQIGQLQKMKVSLETQLSDALKMSEDETKERLLILSKFRHVEAAKEGLKQHLDEAMEEKEDVMRQLSRANADAAMWRSKYECTFLTKFSHFFLL